MTSNAFLLWSGNHSPEVYAAYSLLSLWRRLCVSVKVLDAQGHPPRLHDLRHSFAVGTLLRWYCQGSDPAARLLHLSTFLGHVDPASTAVYLTITAELLEAAGDRFGRYAAPLSTGAMS